MKETESNRQKGVKKMTVKELRDKRHCPTSASCPKSRAGALGVEC